MEATFGFKWMNLFDLIVVESNTILFYQGMPKFKQNSTIENNLYRNGNAQTLTSYFETLLARPLSFLVISFAGN